MRVAMAVLITLMLAIPSTLYVQHKWRPWHAELLIKGDYIYLRAVEHVSRQYYKANNSTCADLPTLIKWGEENNVIVKGYRIPKYIGYIRLDDSHCICFSLNEPAHSVYDYIDYRNYKNTIMLQQKIGQYDIVHGFSDESP